MNILPKHFKRQRRATATATGKGCGALRIAAAAFAERIRRRYRAGQLIPPHLLLFYLSWRRSVPMDRTRRVLVERRVREVQWRCVPALPRQEHGKKIHSLTGIPVDDRKGEWNPGMSLTPFGRQVLLHSSLASKSQHTQAQPANLPCIKPNVAFILGRLVEKMPSSQVAPRLYLPVLSGPAPQSCLAIQPLNMGSRAAADSLAASGTPFHSVCRRHRSGEADHLFSVSLVQSLTRCKDAKLIGQTSLKGKAAGGSPHALSIPRPGAGKTLFLLKEVRSFERMHEMLFRKISLDHLLSGRPSGSFPANNMAYFPQMQRAYGERSPDGRAATRQMEHRHMHALQPSAPRSVWHIMPPTVSAGKSRWQPPGTVAPLVPVLPQHTRNPVESALPGQEHSEPGGSVRNKTRRNAASWLGQRMSGLDASAVSAYSPSAGYRQVAGQKGALAGPVLTMTATRQIMLLGGSARTREPGKLATSADSLHLPARTPGTIFRRMPQHLSVRNAITSTGNGLGSGTAQSEVIAGFAAALPELRRTSRNISGISRNTNDATALFYRQPAAMAASNSLPPGAHFAPGDHRQFTAEQPRRYGQDGVENPGNRKEAAALASAMEQHGKKTVQEYLQNLPPHEVSAVAEKVYGLIEKRLMVEHDRRGWL